MQSGVGDAIVVRSNHEPVGWPVYWSAIWVGTLTALALMLRSLGIRASWRSQIFSFSVGEITNSLPIGNYFQNYLLEREKGVAVAYTAAGTTITILLEVAVCVVYLAIFGIRGWAWVRPLMIGGALGVALGDLFPHERVHFIFGASREKDIAGMFTELLPHASSLILTRYQQPRAASLETLAQLAAPFNATTTLTPSVAEALALARAQVQDGDVICATGSLFVAAEARAIILEERGIQVELDAD